MAKQTKKVLEVEEPKIHDTVVTNTMYRVPNMQRTSINVCNTIEGETIEMKIERVLNNGEPIEDGAPIIYTERKDGVIAETDIRTDRFEAALDLTDTMHRSHLAERQSRIDIRDGVKPENKPPLGGAGEESGA